MISALLLELKKLCIFIEYTFCTPVFLPTDEKHHAVTGSGNYETLIAFCHSCFRIC